MGRLAPGPPGSGVVCCRGSRLRGRHRRSRRPSLSAHRAQCGPAPVQKAEETLEGLPDAPGPNASSGLNANWGGSGFPCVRFYLQLCACRPEPACCGKGPLSARWQSCPVKGQRLGVLGFAADRPLRPWWYERGRGPHVDCGGWLCTNKTWFTSTGRGQEGHSERGSESGTSPRGLLHSLSRGCAWGVWWPPSWTCCPVSWPSESLRVGDPSAGAWDGPALHRCTRGGERDQKGARPLWVGPPERMPRGHRGCWAHCTACCWTDVCLTNLPWSPGLGAVQWGAGNRLTEKPSSPQTHRVLRAQDGPCGHVDKGRLFSRCISDDHMP